MSEQLAESRAEADPLRRANLVRDRRQELARAAELEQILPEASTLDLYGIQKASFTNIKNLILKEIRARSE